MLKTYKSIASLIVIAAVAGCGNIFSKPYPEKVRYAFAVPTPAETRPAGTLQPLRIAMIKANPPYDGLSLVYKTGPATFAFDYYKTFIAQPDSLLTGEVESYLSRCGLFSSVSLGAMTNARYYLESDLVQLYGDFVKNSPPAAVISIRFFLIDDENAIAKVLLQKTYRHSEPIPKASAEELVAGWNKALGVIMGELASDIKTATYEAQAPAATNASQK